MVPEVYRALSERWEQQGKPSEGWVFPTGSTSGHLEESTAKIQHAGALRKLAAATTAHKAWSKNESPGDWSEWVATTAGLDVGFISRHAPVIKSGLKPFEPYCLRHSALTRLGEAGCDTFTLAKIAGHSSIIITQRYIHPQADAIQRAFAISSAGLLAEGAGSGK